VRRVHRTAATTSSLSATTAPTTVKRTVTKPR
jgi:hypothetical protein